MSFGARDATALNDAVIEEAESNEKFAPLYEQRKRLCDFPDPLPDEQNPNAIFRDGYLRTGSYMMLVGMLGAGKSSICYQGSQEWSVGKPFMGIRPARALSIGVFETEDDDTEVAVFRNDFRRGFAENGWSQEEIRASEAPVYYPVGELSGIDFLDYLEFCEKHEHHDLYIINPVYDFIKGDYNRADVVLEWKNRLLELARKYNFAVLLIHHTNKPPQTKRERSEWNHGAAAAYAGSGSMVLPAAARAVIFLSPTETEGFYVLNAAKRGKQLGWKDSEGKPTTSKVIAHSEGIIFWREPSSEELESKGIRLSRDNGNKRTARKNVSAERRKGQQEKMASVVLDAVSEAGVDSPLSTESLEKTLKQQGFTERPIKELLKLLKSRKRNDGRCVLEAQYEYALGKDGTAVIKPGGHTYLFTPELKDEYLRKWKVSNV